MGFFPLRTPPGTTWPALVLPEANPIWAIYLELDRTQWLSPAALEEGQLAQARTLLEHAREHVPYYRRLLTEARIAPEKIQTMADFRRLPLLERRTYQEQGPHMRAAGLPPGMVATRQAFTSGSSGVPVEVLQTNTVNNLWYALYLRDSEWCGFDQRGTLAVIRTTGFKGSLLDRALQGIVSPSWHPALVNLLDTGPCHQMDIHQDARRQIAWLRRIQPDYHLNFPSNLDYLARLVQEEGGPIKSLRAIQAVAETLAPEVQARIEAAFGVPVKNTYSCTEAGYLASPCPLGHGLHVHAENVILEVLDAGGQPCAPGQTGRVVLTALHNFRAPFIRYDIHDEATLGQDRCPCGRGATLLARVQGRRRPMFVMPGGLKRYSSPLIIGLENLDGIFQYQIVQKAADHLLVRVVANRNWTEEHPQRITAMAHAFFEAPIRVDVQCLERIELPAGGKHRVAWCEVE